MAEVQTGTRWGRTGGLMASGFLVIGVLISMMHAQVIAVGFKVSSGSMSFSTGGLSGDNFGIGVAQIYHTGYSSERNILRAGFASGRMDGLCLTRDESIPGIGYTVRMKMTAGDGIRSTNPSQNEIRAFNAVIDVQKLRTQGSGLQLQGRSEFGLASADVTTINGPSSSYPVPNPLEAPGRQGYYGIDADKAQLSYVKGRIYDAEFGDLYAMPNLKIQVGTTSSLEACDAASASYPG